MEIFEETYENSSSKLADNKPINITESTVEADKDEKAQCPKIERSFTYQKPVGTQPERYVKLREQAKSLAHKIAGLCPDSREKVLALTKLEESIMWANKAIAVNEV